MVKAFVFGKYLPFHKGHQALIEYALQHCDFLSILVCCSDRETIADQIRKKWIQQTFEGYKNIEINSFNYLESELPNTSVSSRAVSKIWAKRFKQLFPDYSLVITSEPYGDYVAEFMGIRHLAFDIPRALTPISATTIRQNLFSNWSYLPNAVKQNFAIKVVLLGTESTGKTTLTQKLAQHFNCSEVLEAGRDLIPDSKAFEHEDLTLVAAEHAKRIEQALTGNSPLLIIDTDIHITKSYSKFIFQKELKVSHAIYQINQAQLYLYLNNQIDYVQDGTRLHEEERNLLDHSHRKTLQEHHIEVIEITGHWNQRFNQAVDAINDLLEKSGQLSLRHSTG